MSLYWGKKAAYRLAQLVTVNSVNQLTAIESFFGSLLFPQVQNSIGPKDVENKRFENMI